MREEEEGGAVVLKGARLSDSGVLKCVATNILGRAVATSQLSIEGMRQKQRQTLCSNDVFGTLLFEEAF